MKAEDGLIFGSVVRPWCSSSRGGPASIAGQDPPLGRWFSSLQPYKNVFKSCFAILMLD